MDISKAEHARPEKAAYTVLACVLNPQWTEERKEVIRTQAHVLIRTLREIASPACTL